MIHSDCMTQGLSSPASTSIPSVHCLGASYFEVRWIEDMLLPSLPFLVLLVVLPILILVSPNDSSTLTMRLRCTEHAAWLNSHLS